MPPTHQSSACLVPEKSVCYIQFSQDCKAKMQSRAIIATFTLALIPKGCQLSVPMTARGWTPMQLWLGARWPCFPWPLPPPRWTWWALCWGQVWAWLAWAWVEWPWTPAHVGADWLVNVAHLKMSGVLGFVPWTAVEKNSEGCVWGCLKSCEERREKAWENKWNFRNKSERW